MPYIVSLGVGLGVGVIYALIDVRSPAPPLVALVGLLGMVLGEQAVLRMRSRPASPTTVSTQPKNLAVGPGRNDLSIGNGESLDE